MSSLFNPGNFLGYTSRKQQYKPMACERKTSWNDDLQFVIKSSPTTSNNEIPSYSEVNSPDSDKQTEVSMREAREEVYRTLSTYSRAF